MSTFEGKSPLNFAGYIFLSKKACRADEDIPLGMFSWLFLVLCWNLIARCNSVASIMYDHIKWEIDAMTIVFPSHKGDKEGRRSIPKRVYANPNCPEICPILSFAVYFFTSGWRREGAKKTVFADVTDTEKRFSRWLRSVCTVEERELANMGLTVVQIGTHSFRKGVATFLSSMIGGPNPVSIFLRAGWSLGPVQSRYILEGEGSDQLCGRAAAGHSITDANFAILPPHFNLSDGPILSEEQWDTIVPG